MLLPHCIELPLFLSDSQAAETPLAAILFALLLSHFHCHADLAIAIDFHSFHAISR